MLRRSLEEKLEVVVERFVTKVVKELLATKLDVAESRDIWLSNTTKSTNSTRKS